MGKHDDETTILSVRLPNDVAAQVRATAAGCGMSTNRYLRTWLTSEMEQYTSF
jgi:hypothetical protein